MKKLPAALLFLGLLVGCSNEGQPAARPGGQTPQESSATGAFTTNPILQHETAAVNLYKQGRYADAHARAQLTFDLHQKQLPRDGDRHIRILKALCKSTFALKQYDPSIRHANAILELARTDEDRSFAHNQLGAASLGLGAYDQAIQHHEQALALTLRTLELDSP